MGYDGKVYKINPADCSLITTVNVGIEPYTYSDTTGNIVMQFIEEGWWEVLIGVSETSLPINWRNVTWKEKDIKEEEN